jgi:hypothetical protein
MLHKFLTLFFVLSIISYSTNAQSNYNKDDFKSKPVWITMMDDEKVNYYQAIEAYELYWKDKVQIEGEDDIINEKASRKEEKEREKQEKQLRKMKPADRNNYDQLKYQNKRFKNWMNEVKPFVQEDGRILSRQERIDIWQKQQEEIKSIKK